MAVCNYEVEEKGRAVEPRVMTAMFSRFPAFLYFTLSHRPVVQSALWLALDPQRTLDNGCHGEVGR